jgi:hypothetical protein
LVWQAGSIWIGKRIKLAFAGVELGVVESVIFACISLAVIANVALLFRNIAE